MDKLIIKKKVATHKTDAFVVKISAKANDMLEEIAKRTGKSKASIANLLIEFAYKRVEIVDADDDDEEE